MTKSHRHHKGGEKKGGFFNFRHDIFESLAYRDMKPNARCALNEIIRRFNGFNNGYISFSVREMAVRLPSLYLRGSWRSSPDIFTSTLLVVRC